MTTSRSRSRRAVVFAAVLLGLISVFVTRLVDIQVVRAASLSEQATELRSAPKTVYGARGDILDADGVVLADSVMRWDIALSPSKAKAGPIEREVDGETVDVPLEETAEALGAVVGLTGDQVLGIIEAALAEDPDSDFAYVSKLVDVTTYEAVQALDIPWVVPWRHPSRTYPNGSVAGNLIGFTGDDGDALAGLELSEDACLAGQDGLEQYLYGAGDYTPIPDSTVVLEEARDGGDLKLTIDSDLQWYVQRVAAAQVAATGAAWATVTVMEVETGRLLAVADVPTVDPNDPAASDSSDRGSRAFTASFEPGSTFKTLTAAAVVDAGEDEPGVVAPYRYLPSNGANINDSHFHEDERMTLTGVLVDSSNTGMSLFGERLSDSERFGYLEAFGIGQSTEVGFLAEDPGILHDWRDWDNQTKYTTMFGQGLTTTAVQIASVYQTIANGGVRMPVTLVEGCVGEDGELTDEAPAEGTRVISEKAAAKTSLMLEQVYRDGWLADRWNVPGYRVAAKTGTAQVPDGNGGYQSGYLVSVSGFAPADDPEFVVSVSIMDPVKMNSSAASAPVFQEVMSQVLKSNRTTPSGAEAPELPAHW
ncbi:cell division protein FtsI [Agromyces rhizosphaerae]|uniref:Cell division protein FtsI n=1 Tax=Agromyces rhizosphaerae TaxID=88374 RepID=A0A9W6CYM0_9MICO|nr:penicillin-binding protein 2 [Agromyces rhizosphaerae]GLI29082.1 cell division protein FtsI [Agromyces rhizosphaerae]